MSLWRCREHGLYGGDPYCPQCGNNGNYMTIAAAIELRDRWRHGKGAAIARKWAEFDTRRKDEPK